MVSSEINGFLLKRCKGHLRVNTWEKCGRPASRFRMHKIPCCPAKAPLLSARIYGTIREKCPLNLSILLIERLIYRTIDASLTTIAYLNCRFIYVAYIENDMFFFVQSARCEPAIYYVTKLKSRFSFTGHFCCPSNYCLPTIIQTTLLSLQIYNAWNLSILRFPSTKTSRMDIYYLSFNSHR